MPQGCLTSHGFSHLWSKQALSLGHSSSLRHSGFAVDGCGGGGGEGNTVICVSKAEREREREEYKISRKKKK